MRVQVSAIRDGHTFVICPFLSLVWFLSLSLCTHWFFIIPPYLMLIDPAVEYTIIRFMTLVRCCCCSFGLRCALRRLMGCPLVDPTTNLLQSVCSFITIISCFVPLRCLPFCSRKWRWRSVPPADYSARKTWFGRFFFWASLFISLFTSRTS